MLGVGHMGKLKLVIFDMDGLLFDTERPSYLAMKAAVEKWGFDFPLENYQRIIGLADDECDKQLQEVYGKEFSLEQILQDYQQAFKNILEKEGLGIKPGAEKLLELLDQKGVKKCIASSSSKATIQRYLMKTGLTHLFDFYISGEEVEAGKPNPDIFIEACKRANETPENSLVLEDSLNGLRAAVGAKIKCIVVPDLIEPNLEMKKHAYDIAADLYRVIEIIKVS
jgi:HAD superfamily hydrolase (TIGR01509 family)